MADTFYLDFTVNLTDPVQVAALQAQYPDGYIVAPRTGAAIEFAAPWTDAVPTAAGVAGTWSSWASMTGSLGNFPTDVATFTRKVGGWFGISFLFGRTVRFYWVARFRYNATAEPTGTGTHPVTVNTIAQRRWVDGFELPASVGVANGEGGNNIIRCTRDASRTLDGYGYAIRGATGGVYRLHTVSEYEPAYASGATHSWERVYVRLRRAPATATCFWRTKLFTPSSGGCELYVLPSGQLALHNVTGVDGTELLLTTSDGLVLDAWTRLDILCENNILAAGAGGEGRFRLYRNGATWLEVARPEGASGNTNSGLGVAGAKMFQSEIGNPRGAANTLELDVDDWMGAEFPLAQGAPAAWDAATTYAPGQRVLHADSAYTAAVASTNQAPPNGDYWTREAASDWGNGSHMVLIRPTAFAVDHADWTGDVRQVLQSPPHGTTTGGDSKLASTTSGALLAVETDADTVVAQPGALGCVAFVVGVFGLRPGALTSTLGYQIDAAAAVMAAITQLTTNRWNSVMYRPSGLTAPAPITPLALKHTKTADAGAAEVRGLFAVAELIGRWGPEDQTPDPGAPAALGTAQPRGGVHNAPYGDSPWALAESAPLSPVGLVGGTYVGTGTGIDLTFRFPVHWIWIRPLTGDLGGTKWWSSMVAAKVGIGNGVKPQALQHAETDPSFVAVGGEDAQELQYRIRLSGPIAQANAVGVTYQYVAVCDPAMRFFLNGAFSHHTGVDPASNALANADLLPDAVWASGERVADNATSSLWYKGPGHAAEAASLIDGVAETAVALAISTGSLSSRQISGLHTTVEGDVAYSAWRKHDGSEDPGAVRVVAIGTYTGDGAASRSVGFSPAPGVRPLWGIVVPHTSALKFMRDPSHTGTTSSNAAIGGAVNASTGITGGAIDGFTVGSLLNANGVVYDYFMLLGSATAGNGGWSPNGEFIPVEPNAPSDGDWDPPPEDEAPVEPGDDGPVDPLPPGDTAAGCVAATTRVCNIALQRIGVTQQIADVALEASREAMSARLVYSECVEATLRDFWWPFATAYADLVLVGGTALVPVNHDWQYSYRLPADSLFARRIAKKGPQRAFDPDPIRFRIGRDAVGPLLYTNEAIVGTGAQLVPVVLEYTIRPTCAAGAGDALFRSALAWRLAHELAPGLARDDKKQADCWRMYLHTLQLAATKGAAEQQQDPPGDAEWIRGR